MNTEIRGLGQPKLQLAPGDIPEQDTDAIFTRPTPPPSAESGDESLRASVGPRHFSPG